MSAHKADIIIIGAGLVGLSLALALRHAHCNIIIIDRNSPRFDFDEASFDLRVSAISPASQQFFDEIGIWQKLSAERLGYYQKIQVWDSETSGNIQFDALEVGKQYLGHIIENRLIRRSLFKELEKCEHVQFLYTKDNLEIKRQNALWAINSRVFGQASCRLLVGADGSNSMVREACGFQIDRKSYQQHALVSTIKTEKKHGNTACQRFLPTGPLAFLPLWDQHYCSVVWSTTPANARTLIEMNEKAFNQRLMDAFALKLGKAEVLAERASFPLYRQHAISYVKEGVALIGDAAHTIHPLAGQGVNLGFLDAKTLAATIQKALTKQRPINSIHLLKTYQRKRYAHNQLVMSLMDGFDHLFSTKNEPFKSIRSVGLNMTNQFAPLKSLLIKQAMGIYSPH